MTNTQTQTKIFKVQVDQLCTIWTTSTKTIEATNQEEADKIAFEMYNKDESNRNLRLFYLLHLIHIKKMYNLQFLDMLINPILEIMREMNL